MKNKKEPTLTLSTKWTIIFICVLVLILGVIIWAAIVGVFDEPHFAIYKEECGNETYIGNLAEIWDYWDKIDMITGYYNKIGCRYIKENNLSTKFGLCVEYERLIKELKESSPHPVEEIKEICELVEVDEIDICDNEIKTKPDSYGFRGCNNGCCPIIILKQDLTIEWLDENCECKNEVMECKLFKCCPFFSRECHPNYECLEYKCEFDETYYVETWGQIK